MVLVPFIFPERNLTLKGRTFEGVPQTTLALPMELHQKMKAHPEVEWGEFVRSVIALGIRDLDWRDELARGTALTRSVIFLIDDVVKEGPSETIRSLDKAVKTTLWESAPDPQDTVPILPGQGNSSVEARVIRTGQSRPIANPNSPDGISRLECPKPRSSGCGSSSFPSSSPRPS